MEKEPLEFAITQYLDGTLPPEERAALEQVFSTDPTACELLEQYRSLDNSLKHALPLPQIDFNRLAQNISAAVDQQQSAATAIDEQAELAITHYVDGRLSPDEHAEVSRQLQANPAARHLAHDYASLDRLIKHALPLPNLNWGRLAERISESVADAAERARYSLVWVRRSVQLAAAACILVIVGLTSLLLMNRHPGNDKPTQVANKIVNIETFVTDSPTGQPIADITIGATNDLADSSYSSAEVVGRSSARLSITVAQGLGTPSDNSLFQQ